jgi:hypothetical protein
VNRSRIRIDHGLEEWVIWNKWIISGSSEVLTMGNINFVQHSVRKNQLCRWIASAALTAAAGIVQIATPAPLKAADNRIVIRPANFDPADELAYTRQRGELDEGASASGKTWNKPDSRAAVSGEAPAPADAVGLRPPVSAASGPPLGRMSYAEAYAQIPFSRTEYEANPNYRHDAAMELMFGTMRPMMISRQNIPYFSRYPDLFRYRNPVYPYPFLGSDISNTNMWWNTSLIAY